MRAALNHQNCFIDPQPFQANPKLPLEKILKEAISKPITKP